MRTTVNRFECDRCGLVEMRSHGSSNDPKWESIYRSDMCIDVSETNDDLLTICASCCAELKSIRELGEEMIRNWFNERDRSKTTT